MTLSWALISRKNPSIGVWEEERFWDAWYFSDILTSKSLFKYTLHLGGQSL